MDDAHGEAGIAEERPALAGGAVEGARSLAAAGDEDGQDRTSRLGRDLEELLADGEAGDLRSGEVASRFGEGDQGTGNDPADGAVGESGDSVGLHDDDRDAKHESGEDRRAGNVAAHAEDGAGAAD